LKLTEGEAERNVSSDSDDDKYLNVFNEVKKKPEGEEKGPEKEIIGKLHKDINRDFYLRYLDWMMRMLFTGSDSALERA
jgi:hypothetical protein